MLRKPHGALLFLAVFAVGCGPSGRAFDADRATKALHVGTDTPRRYGVYTSYEHYIRARLLVEKGELAEAAMELEEALFADPDDFLLRTEYAQLLIEMGRTSRARVHLARALLVEPTAQPAWLGVAELHMKEGEEDLAEEAARQGARTEPGSSEAHLWLARYYRDKGDVQGASELFEEVLSKEPKNTEALKEMGALETLTGMTREAVWYYTRYLAAGGREANAALELAGLLVEKGEVLQGIRLVEALVGAYPERPEIRERLIRMLLDQGFFRRAAKHIHSLPALPFGDYDGIARRGSWLAEAGRMWDARKLIVDAAGESPEDARVRLELARVELGLGRTESARLLLDAPNGGWPKDLREEVEKMVKTAGGGQ